MQSYFELGEDEKTRRMSPWLLRIELNRCAAASSPHCVPKLPPPCYPSCLLQYKLFSRHMTSAKTCHSLRLGLHPECTLPGGPAER